MNEVSVRKCDDYNEELVYNSLCKVIEDLGGIDAIIPKKDSKVLIKSNLLKRNKPQDMVTTHPFIIMGLIKILKENGINNITIADSPGGPFTKNALKGIYATTGMEYVASTMGVKLNYDTDYIDVVNENARTHKNFSLCKFIADSDVIIDCAKLKTHCMTTYSGAVKNLYGCVPGTTKVSYHYLYPNIEDFSSMLLDIAMYVKPQLAIIDAIYGMEGDGPSGGEPRKIGTIIGSTDINRCDLVATHLINLSPFKVCTLCRAIENGYITGDIEKDVVLKGDDICDLIVDNYKMPRTTGVKLFSAKSTIPKPLQEFLGKLYTPYPQIVEEMCIGCEICKNSCPADAITMKNKIAKINKKTCIKCFCCHEFCPKKAIDIKKPFLAKLL